MAKVKPSGWTNPQLCSPARVGGPEDRVSDDRASSSFTSPGASTVLSCFSHVRLFATLWTIARQAPRSMGFSSVQSGGQKKPRSRHNAVSGSPPRTRGLEQGRGLYFFKMALLLLSWCPVCPTKRAYWRKGTNSSGMWALFKQGFIHSKKYTFSMLPLHLLQSF